MSELNDRVDKIAEYSWLKLISRLALPIIAFVGISAWNDLREQGVSIQQVLRNQAVSDTKIEDALRRISKLEDIQQRTTFGTNP